MAAQNLCCTICSETYKCTDEILATKCGHVFHGPCFQDWKTRSLTCPECREENPASQRIYLHIEESSEADGNLLDTKIELVNKISLLERQLEENEKNFFDVQHALSICEEQIKELKQQIELTNAENASYDQELRQKRQALEESEQNFMNLLEQLKRCETELSASSRKIDFLNLQNDGREKKINDLIAQHTESNIKSEELRVMLENKLKISNNQIIQLNKDMNKLKIENQNQRIDMDFSCLESNKSADDEKVKRLENKLKQLSLELDKEIKLSMNLTVENMKLKNIIALPLSNSEDKQKVANKCEEQRQNSAIDRSGICSDLIDLVLQ